MNTAITANTVRPDSTPDEVPTIACFFIDESESATVQVMFWNADQAEAVAAEALRCAERLRAYYAEHPAEGR